MNIRSLSFYTLVTVLAGFMLPGCASQADSKHQIAPDTNTSDSAPVIEESSLLAAMRHAPEQLKTSIFQLRSTSPYQQIKGIRALRTQLPEAEIAIPLLINLLNKQQNIALYNSPFDAPNENLTTLGLEALETLIAIGDAAVPALLDLLTRPDALIRKRAAYALGEIGDSRAMTPLQALTRDRNPRVRATVSSAIKKIRSNYLGSPEQVGL